MVVNVLVLGLVVSSLSQRPHVELATNARAQADHQVAEQHAKGRVERERDEVPRALRRARVLLHLALQGMGVEHPDQVCADTRDRLLADVQRPNLRRARRAPLLFGKLVFAVLLEVERAETNEEEHHLDQVGRPVTGVQRLAVRHRIVRVAVLRVVHVSAVFREPVFPFLPWFAHHLIPRRYGTSFRQPILTETPLIPLGNRLP